MSVTTPAGPSDTDYGSSVLPEFYFFYGPTVTSVDPGEGSATGGTSVTIHGTGFSSVRGPDNFPFVDSVDFGSTKLACSTSPNPWFGCSPATFEVDSDTQITASAPPGTGTVDVSVETWGGMSPTNSADRFSYEQIAPSIGIEPATSITQLDATLNGQVNPWGLPASYR